MPTIYQSIEQRIDLVTKTLPLQKRLRQLVDSIWRPVRESNPCRRREREATSCNSKDLRGMDITLPHLKDLIGKLDDS